jgi:transcriptional regulator with XRE-family HTH domain
MPRSGEHAALGQAIRVLRVRRDLTQEALALDSGIDRSFLGGVERGERNVTYSTLLRLARVFDLTGSQLLQAAEAEREEMARHGSAP